MNRMWYLCAIAALILLILLIRSSGMFRFITLDYVKEHAVALHVLVETRFFTMLFAFFLMFMGAMIFFIPITIILTIIAGYLFGVFIGTATVLAAAAVGGSVLFFAIRYGIGSYVQRKYPDSLKNFNSEIEKHGSYYLLILQILPITPTLLINVLSGVSTISWWTYLWTTVVGIMPGTLIYTLAGRQIHEINSLKSIMSWKLIIMLFLLACTIFLPLLLQSYFRKIKSPFFKK